MPSNKEKNFISAVVYVRNNESYIGEFCKNLFLILKDNFEEYNLFLLMISALTDRSGQSRKRFLKIKKKR